MKRIHALEWEDLEWFPKTWRDYGTDYLRFLALQFKMYEPILPVLEKGLAASKGKDWVDIASGGGGSLLHLAKAMKSHHPDLKVVLTDYYPNEQAFAWTKSQVSDLFVSEKESVDARNLPPHLRGKFRTMFASFHHFRPDDARQILQNAVDAGDPIAIFEPLGRNFASWFSMLFVPLNVLLLTPFIRPVRWSVLPFIYILPFVPLFILWDGVASILRVYSESELRAMVQTIKGQEGYDWEIGTKKKGPSGILYLLARPKQ